MVAPDACVTVEQGKLGVVLVVAAAVVGVTQPSYLLAVTQ